MRLTETASPTQARQRRIEHATDRISLLVHPGESRARAMQLSERPSSDRGVKQIHQRPVYIVIILVLGPSDQVEVAHDHQR